jgi:hypothetical protein
MKTKRGGSLRFSAIPDLKAKLTGTGSLRLGRKIDETAYVSADVVISGKKTLVPGQIQKKANDVLALLPQIHERPLAVLNAIRELRIIINDTYGEKADPYFIKDLQAHLFKDGKTRWKDVNKLFQIQEAMQNHLQEALLGAQSADKASKDVAAKQLISQDYGTTSMFIGAMTKTLATKHKWRKLPKSGAKVKKNDGDIATKFTRSISRTNEDAIGQLNKEERRLRENLEALNHALDVYIKGGELDEKMIARLSHQIWSKDTDQGVLNIIMGGKDSEGYGALMKKYITYLDASGHNPDFVALPRFSSRYNLEVFRHDVEDFIGKSQSKSKDNYMLVTVQNAKSIGDIEKQLLELLKGASKEEKKSAHNLMQRHGIKRLDQSQQSIHLGQSGLFSNHSQAMHVNVEIKKEDQEKGEHKTPGLTQRDD